MRLETENGGTFQDTSDGEIAAAACAIGAHDPPGLRSDAVISRHGSVPLMRNSTIARKTPGQLAEVAAAAQRLDRVRNVVMTTGTPPTEDRGAAVLSECAAAIKAATGLPIQAQCEPPANFAWFGQLRAAGVDSLGMHLEAWDEEGRPLVPSIRRPPT